MRPQYVDSSRVYDDTNILIGRRFAGNGQSSHEFTCVAVGVEYDPRGIVWLTAYGRDAIDDVWFADPKHNIAGAIWHAMEHSRADGNSRA